MSFSAWEKMRMTFSRENFQTVKIRFHVKNLALLHVELSPIINDEQRWHVVISSI
jgi:hypothetical protein